MAEFDLVIMPSRFEGLGLVAIEATLCGLPVVATDAPGLREALPPDYPWRARPGDPTSFAVQLHHAIEDRATWASVTANAGEFARKKFDVATMLGAYARLYRNARDGSGNHASSIEVSPSGAP
jgi:glycosyltransferase involved in cell wall biosynthesis